MKQFYFTWLCFAIFLSANAHGVDTLIPKQVDRHLKAVSKKSESIRKKLKLENTKALEKYINTLTVLQRRVALIDRQTADNVFPRLISAAEAFKSKLQSIESMPAQYFGYLDTLQGSVKYIEQQRMKGLKRFDQAKQAVIAFEHEVSSTEQTAALIESGKREVLAVVRNLALNMKELRSLQDQYYYYCHQVEEYKQLFSDPDKVSRKVLEMLQKRPEFASFIAKNSLFAGLLGLPANYNVERSLEDLQTRTQIDNALASRMGSDPSGRQIAAGQMEAAQSQWSNYKSKFPTSKSVDEIPFSNPKPLKTKRLLDRLEPGGSFQFQKTSLYFPATADIIGQLGYKFHKNGIAGIGIAYKLGIGRGWDHVAFSHQGFGLRSFLDWKLKGNLYISGGFEGNKPRGFRQLREIRNWNGYQLSALIGASQKITIKGNKKATTTILYDFLAARQLPKTPAFKLRFGYTFK